MKDMPSPINLFVLNRDEPFNSPILAFTGSYNEDEIKHLCDIYTIKRYFDYEDLENIDAKIKEMILSNDKIEIRKKEDSLLRKL